MRAGLLALLCLLLAAPAAHAWPTPQVSAGGVTVTPSFVASVSDWLTGEGQIIGDGWGRNPPLLYAPPGSDVSITFPNAVETVEAVSAGLTGSSTALVPDAAGVYTFTVPADAPVPAKFWVRVTSSSATMRTQAGWNLDLNGFIGAPDPWGSPTVAQPTPTPVPLPVVTAPLPKPAVLDLRLTGRRLSATVSCPGGCAGYLTLRTASIRIARLELTGSGTFTATIRPAALRHLQRHRVKRLRVLLTTRGRAPVATTRTLQR